MKKLFLSIFVFVLCSVAFSQVDETTRNRYALVIGNQNYSYNKLSTNIADATKVADSLRKTEFDVTFKKDLSSSELKKVVDEYIKKVNSDSRSVSLIYYTGFAFTHNERNYLLPIDNNKFHDEDGAKEYGLDLQSDIADKITTNAQIYIIDGGYDEPFKAEGSRAIGIKGGLAAARSSKESTVGFLFSTAPDMTVEKSAISFGTTIFANAVSEQIEKCSDNLSTVFGNIKSNVSNKTGNAQVPYSSTTTLDFAFNGNELIALKKKNANKAAESTSLKSLELNREFKERETARLNELKLSSAESDAKKAELERIAAEKKAAQEEQDRLRREEDERKASERSSANNAKIANFRSEFSLQAKELAKSIQKGASADERIEYIETNKGSLRVLRDELQEQIDNYNAEIDVKVSEDVAEVWNRPLGIVEQSKGVMTADARKRREKEEFDIRADGSMKEALYKQDRMKEAAKDDSVYLPLIKKGYDKLEGGTYTVTSLDDTLRVRVDDYDGETASWNLHITSELFGYTDVFEQDVKLSYSDVTGKKNTKVSSMNNIQLAEYNDDVEIYDALFRSATPVFFVKLSYKVMRWEQASEYHFIPTKVEIVRIGKKQKTISKKVEKDLDSSNFIKYPQIEIRTSKEIEADYKRAEKTIEAEKVAKGLIEKPIKEPKVKKEKEPKAKAETLKGRSGLYVTFDYSLTDIFKTDTAEFFEMSDYDNPYAIDWQAHLTLSPARFLYTELSFGMQKWKYEDLYDESNDETKETMDKNVYIGKFMTGITFPIGSHFRPYGGVGASFTGNPYNYMKNDSDMIFGLHAGVGLDFIFSKHMMLTFGWNYGWMHYIESFKNGIIDNTTIDLMKQDVDVDYKKGFTDVLSHPDFHKNEFSIGFGFTW